MSSVKEARTLSDSEHEMPALKKPRIEAVVEVSEADNLKVYSAMKEAASSEANKPATKKDGKKKQSKRQKRKVQNLPEPCSPEDVLWRDIISVLGQDAVDAAMEEGSDLQSPFAVHDEIEAEVKILGSNGACIVTPQGAPGLTSGKGRVLLFLWTPNGRGLSWFL